MTKRNRQQVQDRRNAKKDNPNHVPQSREINEKVNTSPLKSLNPVQANYIANCRNKPVNIATGFAGTSKTYIPTRVAIEKLAEGEIEKIVIVRPNISDSKSLGYFAGSLEEKISNWIRPVLDIFHEFIGRSQTEYLIKQGVIDAVPLEIIKGMSFKKAFIIVDEAEDLTEKEFIKCITRLGEGSTMVFAGDVLQCDLGKKDNSGLLLAADMAKKCQKLNWGYVDFDRPSDIVRSNNVREAILEFRQRGLM